MIVDLRIPRFPGCERMEWKRMRRIRKKEGWGREKDKKALEETSERA